MAFGRVMKAMMMAMMMMRVVMIAVMGPLKLFGDNIFHLALDVSPGTA